MITPKPATVFELFNGHPERWTKGANARDASGMLAFSNQPEAACWCLNGAMIFVYEGDEWEVANSKMNSVLEGVYFVEWQDSHSTTFDMMLAKVKEAGI